MAPPRDTSLVRAFAASRNSTGPRSSPVATRAVLPAPVRAARTRVASSAPGTPGSGSTPTAATSPGRPASRAASSSAKNSEVCCRRSPSAGAATPLTRYSRGAPVDRTVSRAPGARPVRPASSRSTTTSSAPAGAAPATSVNGVSGAEVQACPREGPPSTPASTCPAAPTAWAGKVSSGSTARTPGNARSPSTVPAGSQARSPSGFSLCLVFVFPPPPDTVTWWTFWSAATSTGVPA